MKKVLIMFFSILICSFIFADEIILDKSDVVSRIKKDLLNSKSAIAKWVVEEKIVYKDVDEAIVPEKISYEYKYGNSITCNVKINDKIYEYFIYDSGYDRMVGDYIWDKYINKEKFTKYFFYSVIKVKKYSLSNLVKDSTYKLDGKNIVMTFTVDKLLIKDFNESVFDPATVSIKFSISNKSKTDLDITKLSALTDNIFRKQKFNLESGKDTYDLDLLVTDISSKKESVYGSDFDVTTMSVNNALKLKSDILIRNNHTENVPSFMGNSANDKAFENAVTKISDEMVVYFMERKK